MRPMYLYRLNGQALNRLSSHHCQASSSAGSRKQNRELTGVVLKCLQRTCALVATSSHGNTGTLMLCWQNVGQKMNILQNCAVARQQGQWHLLTSASRRHGKLTMSHFHSSSLSPGPFPAKEASNWAELWLCP